MKSTNFHAAGLQRQNGIGFIGLVLILAVLGFFVVLGMRIGPAVMEYQAIEKTVKRIATEQPAATPQEWRNSFDRFAQIDTINSIMGKDLIIERNQQGASIAFAYDKKIPLYGPASVLLEFKGNSSTK